MKFVTLFLKTENVHLLKDVGMIPYLLYRDYRYEASIVTFRNEEQYPYLEREVKGLELIFLKHRFPGKILDGMLYLCKHAKEIDILNVYHLNLSSFFWLIIYRLFRKKGGRAYLKLDMNPIGLKTALAANPVGMIKRSTIRMADVVSVETTLIYDRLKEKFGSKILYLPNGCFMPEVTEPVEKKNVILTVGKPGMWEKATDVLLDAFKKADLPRDWKLRVVGPVVDGFQEEIDKFLLENEILREQIEFTGPVFDKSKLARYYEEAKIFAFPSRSESYGLALIEAVSHGCMVVTTKGVPLGYDICNGGKFGAIVDIDDADGIANEFRRLSESAMDWERMAQEIKNTTKTRFAWEPVIKSLVGALEN